MPEHFTYLAVDLGCILFPFLFSFHPRLRFYKEWRHFWLPCLATGLIFVLWDIIYTRWGVWGFNSSYVLGPYLWGLPLEEYLFFLCIPYACSFTYHCFNILLPSVSQFQIVSLWVCRILIVVLFFVGLTQIPRLYTSVTFISLAVFLSVVIIKGATWLPMFLITFLVIQLPFFISNGILTGSFLGRTVVWYSPAHNMGHRMLTIPVEDVFYGMLLLVMNVAGMEWRRGRRMA